MTRQKGFASVLLLIVIVIFVSVGYFGYKNYKSSTPIPTVKPENNQNIATPSTILPITCENAFKGDESSRDLITVSENPIPGSCKLTFNPLADSSYTSYSLSFPKGFQIRFTGADISAAIGFYQKGADTPNKTIYFIPDLLTSDSSTDITQPEKIKYQYDEDHVSTIFNSYQQTIDRQNTTLGEKPVFILTQYSQTTSDRDKSLGYTRTYFLIDKAKKILYSLEIYSGDSKFDSSEDKERLKIIEGMIISLKY